VTEQLPLLFASTSDTSAAAALSVSAADLREEVLFAIRASGAHGMTCDEIETLLEMRHQTASARVHELQRGKWIKDSGQRRATRSGRKATVWTAA
jgi:hypothetical protein